MTNEELLCRLESILKERGMTLYELQKQSREEVIKGSTFYSMFEKRSAVKIEYICEFCRVLDISVAQLIDEKNSQRKTSHYNYHIKKTGVSNYSSDSPVYCLHFSEKIIPFTIGIILLIMASSNPSNSSSSSI